jgi:hypothetical protein
MTSASTDHGGERFPRRVDRAPCRTRPWLTFTLTLTLLMAFTSPGAAQEMAEEKSRPTLRGGATGMPMSGLSRMTGKVTEVNDTAKTFTVMANGKAATFTGPKVKDLPKVGEIVDITYTGPLAGPWKRRPLDWGKATRQTKPAPTTQSKNTSARALLLSQQLIDQAATSCSSSRTRSWSSTLPPTSSSSTPGAPSSKDPRTGESEPRRPAPAPGYLLTPALG